MIETMISLSERAFGKFHYRMRRLPIFALLFMTVPLPAASSIPPVTGSYTVLQHSTRGPQAQIRLRIHLVNPGASDLVIQRITLSNLTHAERGASHVCAVTVRAHTSLETTQEFTIPRAEYQLWQRGMKPRFVLGVASPGGAGKSIAVILQNRVPSEEAK